MAEAGLKGNIDDQWMTANKVLDPSNTSTNISSDNNEAITTNSTLNAVPNSSPTEIRNLVGNNTTANQVLEPSHRSSSSSSSSENKASIATNIETYKSKTHQNVVPKSSPAGRRLNKELMTMVKDPPDGITIAQDTLEGDDLSAWKVGMTGPSGTLFDGEHFNLQFKFGPKYPFDSPEVIFIGDDIPVHPHIYSNGHICLSILTEDWSPALSVQAVCISIISMLASCKEKKRPPDNSFYVKTCHKNPKKTRWWYHDDTV